MMSETIMTHLRVKTFMDVLRRDVLRLLLVQLVQLPFQLRDLFPELLHMTTHAVLQKPAELLLVARGPLPGLRGDLLEEVQDHGVVRDGLRRVRLGRLGRRVRAQALDLCREARRAATLRELDAERAEPREQDVVACDLGFEVGDPRVALVALLVDVALLPSARAGSGRDAIELRDTTMRDGVGGGGL